MCRFTGRRNRPRDGRPRAPAGHPGAAGSLCVVRLGRPSTTTVNLRPRRGLVRATINGRDRRGALVQAATSSSGRRRGVERAATSSPGAGGAVRTRRNRGGCRRSRNPLPPWRPRPGPGSAVVQSWALEEPRAAATSRWPAAPAPQRLHWLVHTPVRARTRLRVVRLLRPSATTVNLHRRGGLVRVAISSSRRRCDLGAIAVGVGGLGIRCHDGGRALAGLCCGFELRSGGAPCRGDSELVGRAGATTTAAVLGWCTLLCGSPLGYASSAACEPGTPDVAAGLPGCGRTRA